MSFRDGRNFDPEYALLSDDGLNLIEVAKLGGGTVGNEYAGSWGVTVNGKWLGWSYVTTGMPHSHAYVAQMVADSLAGE